MKKLSNKDYNKRITTHDNGNVQSHDQEKRKLNSTINTNSGDHITYTWLNNKKVNSIKNKVATIKANKILTKILLLGPAN